MCEAISLMTKTDRGAIERIAKQAGTTPECLVAALVAENLKHMRQFGVCLGGAPVSKVARAAARMPQGPGR